MTFYERYEKVCKERGWEPCSQKAADAFGVTRATISIWKKRNTAPRGETVKDIADMLGVSCDYLLGRTDNPTDYAVQSHMDEDFFTMSIDGEKKLLYSMIQIFDKLDDSDKIRVVAYAEGVFSADKYSVQKR